MCYVACPFACCDAWEDYNEPPRRVEVSGIRTRGHCIQQKGKRTHSSTILRRPCVRNCLEQGFLWRLLVILARVAIFSSSERVASHRSGVPSRARAVQYMKSTEIITNNLVIYSKTSWWRCLGCRCESGGAELMCTPRHSASPLLLRPSIHGDAPLKH